MKIVQLHVTAEQLLPPMPCERCGQCCGVVPVSRQELELVTAYVRDMKIKPVKQGPTCPWFQDKGCAVYKVRPLLCRLYGHTAAMRCPRGHSTPADPSVERLMERHTQHCQSGLRFLHEAVMKKHEILLMLNQTLRGGAAGPA